MIPATIVFITMPGTPDFTGPIIGIVGVLIGSAIGFLGLYWQHTAQRAYDIRKIAANFLAAGEELREHYFETKNSPRLTADMNAVLRTAEAKLNEMYRHAQHLQLVANPAVTRASVAYLEASEIYHTYTRSIYGAGTKPTEQEELNSFVRWSRQKSGLVRLLNNRRGKSKHQRAGVKETTNER